MTASEIKISYTNRVSKAQRTIIRSSHQAAALLRTHWDSNTIELQEDFKALFLNRSNEVLGIYNLSKGGSTTTVVDAKLLFGVALKIQAQRIILCHNHPSGNLKPSREDKRLTAKLMTAAMMLDMDITDHIILTRESYCSFRDNSLLRYENITSFLTSET